MPGNIDILNSLNQEQLRAVINTDGPSIILAGAGSGKTRVLVYKVLYLILEKGISPSNILMVTFTNKAASEMLERIEKVLINNVKRVGNRPTIGTFHSLCARILRRSGYHIGIPHEFIIYDGSDQQEVVKLALKKLDIPQKQIRPRSALATISQAKNEMIDPQGYASLARGYFQESVAKIYPLYQSILKNNNALDFDDLLLETIRLFKKTPSILHEYQNRFKYILIDEYQDTNRPQYEITKLLGSSHRNVCIVGDFSQSIYSFRGADYRNLERFQKDFSEHKVFSLSQNYRSTQNILDAASSVISKNTSHPILSLWTENEKGDDIVVFEAEDEHKEVEFIINHASSLNYSDIAILYRTNAQSRIIEEVLLHHSIPYVLIGGIRFYARREVKDVLAMLSALANLKDTISISRIEKIGKKRLEKFLAFQKDLIDKNLIAESSTLELLDNVVKATDYLSSYDENIPEDKSRLENIKELRSVAIEFPNLIQFLENVALVEQDYLPDHATRPLTPERSDGGRVTLMTLHQAKGLEFKMVAIIGMEEGIFPHSQSLFDQSEIEEERRLCYVGMTRAKEKLCLVYSRKRLLYGQRSNNMVSRFILELPPKILEKSLFVGRSFDFKSRYWEEEPF